MVRARPARRRFWLGGLALALLVGALLCASAAVGGLALVGVALVARVAGPRACEPVQRTDLSLEQMGSLKRRVEAMDASPDDPLRVSGEEASFILNDHYRYPVWIEVDDDILQVQVAQPVEPGGDRCYHLTYRGSLEVDAGDVVAVPERVVVGRLDLGPILRGVPIRFGPSVLGPGDGAEVLRNVAQLRVRGGAIEVVLVDPGLLP